MDFMTKDERGELMSRIRSKWTGPEMRLHGALKGARVRHRMHPKMHGRPDAVLSRCGTAVFVDGCFWHGCPRHHKIPKTNKAFWRRKVRGNMGRDGQVNRFYITYRMPYVRIWECELEAGIKALVDKAKSNRK
jgi:DNA mismatch endonuclease (patch repair protein)